MTKASPDSDPRPQENGDIGQVSGSDTPAAESRAEEDPALQEILTSSGLEAEPPQAGASADPGPDPTDPNPVQFDSDPADPNPVHFDADPVDPTGAGSQRGPAGVGGGLGPLESREPDAFGAGTDELLGDDASFGAPESVPEGDLAGALAAAQAEAGQFKEKWMRSMAELENFRKRSRREIENTINFANANLLRDLLDVLDNFDRARTATVDGEEGPNEAYIEGIRLIYQRFVEILRQNGLERVAALRQPFDPNLHEAVSQIEKDGVPSGIVVHVVQEGYTLKEMVLRPAKVVVSK